MRCLRGPPGNWPCCQERPEQAAADSKPAVTSAIITGRALSCGLLPL